MRKIMRFVRFDWLSASLFCKCENAIKCLKMLFDEPYKLGQLLFVDYERR